MERFDAIVVGGGPAGSTVAWQLRRRGLEVLVLDRAEFPRDKVCAGWVTPQVLESLELDANEYARGGRTLQPIHGFRISHGGGSAVVTRRSPEPISYGIRRCELDHYLLERSAATLRLGGPAQSLERQNGEWVVNGQAAAPLLVGAGGHFCPVARRLGAKTGAARPVIVAQEVEFELSDAARDLSPVDPQVPELDFCADLRGYGWVFRKGRVLNFGLGREDTERLGDHVQTLRRLFVDRGRLPEETPERFSGHAYHLYSHPPRKLLDDGVLLVGDAAGLAYAQSGEGIRTAVESALLAVGTIVAAGGDYRGEKLASYGRALRRRFGPRSNGGGPGRLLPEGPRRALAGALLRREWFARRVVAERWFLHARTDALRGTVAAPAG